MKYYSLRVLNKQYEEIYRFIAKRLNIENITPLIMHVSVVCDYSLEILKKFKINDESLIKRVEFLSLYHDIGRLFCKPFGRFSLILHGILSRKIMDFFCEDLSLTRSLATHVGIGLKKEDILKNISETEKTLFSELIEDYLPQSLEEKLVCFADKMVIYNRVVKIEEAFLDFYLKVPEKKEDFFTLQRELFEELINKNSKS
ncbi:MAG: hypothetical protein QXD62_03205 [Candidatus Woesearchaeota archaeon]